ncbi:MAG: PEP-CTERM sorting domain-containing protein, partial [Alphaproteobacteria bacterium]
TLLADLDVADFSSTGISAFSGHEEGWISTGTPYSLTMVVTVTHDNAGDLTSFDAELKILPEPAVLALFGMGLTGLGLLSRRRAARN